MGFSLASAREDFNSDLRETSMEREGSDVSIDDGGDGKRETGGGSFHHQKTSDFRSGS